MIRKDTKDFRIGVFDSGVGGLTVVSQIKRCLPKAPIVYIGDTARVPWGTRSPGTVKTFALQMLRFLEKKGVCLVVVACHTASAVALPMLAKRTKLPVIGVIEPTAHKVIKKTKGRIGIIGTPTTVESRAWERVLRKSAGGKKLKLTSVAAPLLVPVVEEGEEKNELAKELVSRYLEPFKKGKIDTVVLACTHYPLLFSIFKSELPNVRLINPGEETAKYIAYHLGGDIGSHLRRLKSSSDAHDEFYFTDLSDNVKSQVIRFFGREANHLQEVKVR